MDAEKRTDERIEIFRRKNPGSKMARHGSAEEGVTGEQPYFLLNGEDVIA
jgi:hypothetical protein